MMAQHVADEHAQRLAEQVMTLERERETKRREQEAEVARRAAEEAETAEAVSGGSAARA
jgi:hypothetical protein